MRSVLLFAHEIYEDLELWYPKLRLEEAGFKAVVAGPEAGAVYLGKHKDVEGFWLRMSSFFS